MILYVAESYYHVYLSEWVRFHVRDWPNSETGSIKEGIQESLVSFFLLSIYLSRTAQSHLYCREPKSFLIRRKVSQWGSAGGVAPKQTTFQDLRRHKYWY